MLVWNLEYGVLNTEPFSYLVFVPGFFLGDVCFGLDVWFLSRPESVSFTAFEKVIGFLEKVILKFFYLFYYKIFYSV